MDKIGPHSRPHKLAVIDGRRAEAKVMAQFRADMVAHCGGKPSATQRALIDRAAILHLRLVLMDRESIDQPVMSDRTSRHYLAFSNSLGRLLKQLGMKGVPATAPTLANIDWSAHRGKGIAA
jgi:hypothetical protein